MANSLQNQFLINGRQESCISPLDRGFAYGDGVFRTLPVIDGQPQHWQRHYAKLSEDCHALGIVCPPIEVLYGDISKLCGVGENATLKIIITRGESARGYALPALAQPCRVVLKSPLPSYPDSYFSYGVHLHPCKIRLARQPSLAGIKHLNRLENVLARMEWVDTQIADGLMLDQSGYVIECTMSNIFMRSGNVLTTPNLRQCGVAGLTRQRIIELAPSMGYRVKVASFRPPSLLQAEEVVICNSLYGAWQVRALGEHSWLNEGLAARLREVLKAHDASVA